MPAAGQPGARRSKAADRPAPALYVRLVEHGLEFRLLGPLEVRDGERPLRLGGTKQRSVLAILLLNAGEIVPAERLIDLLWEEAAPDHAASALQQHVSRLRRLLGPGEVVVTAAPGYVVRPPPGSLDRERFAALRERGRDLLAAGDPAGAAATLREALALWRGRALADLEHEPFAVAAVEALEEERLDALEARIDADLDLGRHAQLTSELAELVALHPLRERLRAQQILALYRCGRQAEALEAYATARHTLVEELGLEPGPELRALQQDVLRQAPALDLPRAPARAVPARRRPWRAAIAAALAAAAVVVAGVAATARDDERPPAPALAAATGGEVVAVDAATGRIARRLPAGRTPAALARAPDGRLWAVDADARTLIAVEPATGAVETLATGATPTDVVVGHGAIWVGDGRPVPGAQFTGPVMTHVSRLDAATRTARARTRLPRDRAGVSNHAGNRLAVSAAAVWAAAPAGDVVRIDPRTGAVTARTRRADALAVAAWEDEVWALRPDGLVLALDEATGEVRRRVRLPTGDALRLAAGPGAAWVTVAGDTRLFRVGTDGGVDAVDVGAGATEVAAGPGGAWVADPVAGTLVAVGASGRRVLRTVRLGGVPRALTVAGGTVWAAVAGQEAAAGAQAVRGVDPLPAGTCEPAVAGPGGTADVLVVSDLPLQGGVRVMATQMAQAIAFVLRERDFRAGRFRIAHQSCDDSVARTGLFDEAKCAANARAYGANRDVAVVIGPLNSPCAVAAVPQLNRAPGGPLPMVGPLTSFVGLTRAAPGVDPSLPDALYPTGTRSFLRVYPTDDLQGAALALLARDRGRDAVFVLDDGEPGYGALLARGFDSAARRLGLEVAGRATWDPRARRYRGLARRVAASGAQAVFLGGLLDTNAAAVIRDLRAELGPGVDLMGPDGLTPLPLLADQAGAAGEGVIVSIAGVVPETFPPGGAVWARRFARTQAGLPVQPSAVYAAQAATVALDAIARSDGSRASILRELFATDVRDGLLGDFGFDAAGDITESPVTVMRVTGAGGSRRVQSVEGGEVLQVLRPPARLLAG